jgi:hypothetical protein
MRNSEDVIRVSKDSAKKLSLSFTYRALGAHRMNVVENSIIG